METEHIQHNPESLSDFLLMARDHGLSPVVTIRTVFRASIGRPLDGSALGLYLCHAETPEQVAELVRWTKYPTLGERALAHGSGADYRMDDTARYCA